MAIVCNMVDYEVLDNGLIKVHFVSPAPAPYAQSDFYVVITTAESIQNQTQLKTTLQARLDAKYGSPLIDPENGTHLGQGVTALNTFKGQNITVANT